MTPQKLSGNLNRKLIAFPEKKKYYTLRKSILERLSGKKGRPKWLHSSCRVIHMNCQSPCRCLKRDWFVWKNSAGNEGQKTCPDWLICRQYKKYCQTAACFGFFRCRRFFLWLLRLTVQDFWFSARRCRVRIPQESSWVGERNWYRSGL